MQWSHSRISLFQNCPYEFYLKYINKSKKYLPENNYFAEVGLFVHEMLADILDKKLDIEEAPVFFVENYDSHIKHETKPSIMDKKYESCIDYFSEVDFNWLNNFETLGVELEVLFKIADYNFRGYIDLLLKNKKTGNIVLIDHKSSAYPMGKKGDILKNHVNSFNTYKTQMYLYSHAIKQKYDEFPTTICWNHFTEGGKFMKIPFVKSEYKEVLNKTIERIHKIEKERDFKPNLDYFYCNNLCSFRNCCEYKKREFKFPKK